MPGITAIVKKSTDHRAPQLLKIMLQSMMHQSFYTQASIMKDELGLYAGSVSIKGSFSDCLPVYNETSDLILFFAGECYPDPEIIARLRRQGHEFCPDNASYLIHFYEEAGPDFVKELNGWFSGVILDLKRGLAILFNDRYGMHRIYYYEDGSGFYFASEAKALLKAIPGLRSIDLQGVADYLCFDCVLDNRTYFSNIRLFPGGSMWRFEKGIPQQDSYFDIDTLENQSPLQDGQFFDEMAETFKNILPRYFAGQPVGIALTGGLDTRMIMSCLPGNIGPTTAFTYGGMDRDCVDVKLARKVAAVCGLHHQTIRLDKTFLRNYADHAVKSIYVTDGLAHATNVEGVYLNHLARDIAPVKLTGKFGSQILGKVRRALRKRFPNEQLIHPDFKRHLLPASEALLPYEKEHTLSFVLQREISWFWATATVQEMSQLSVRSPFLDNDLIRLLYRSPKSGFEGSVFQLDFIAKNNPALAAVRTNKGKGGRGSIFSRAIEMSYKTRGMMDKALTWDVLPYHLHHLVARVDAFILSPLHLDQLLVGFEHFRQYTRWFRTEMASQVKAILLDPRTLQRPYWNSQYIVRMLNDHLAGRGRYLSEIRKVLTIELIHRALVEDIESV